VSNQEANVEKLSNVYADIPLPIESYGECIRKNCYGYGILGNGYCVRCWDKGQNKSGRGCTRSK